MLPTAETKATGECNAAEQPTASRKPQAAQLLIWVFTSICLSPCSCSQSEHLDKEYAIAGRANTSFQPTAARQSYPSTPRGKACQPTSSREVWLPLLHQEGCEKPEWKQNTDQHVLLQQTRWVANLPAYSTGPLISTCLNSGTWLQLPSQGMTSPAGSEHQPPTRQNETQL